MAARAYIGCFTTVASNTVSVFARPGDNGESCAAYCGNVGRLYSYFRVSESTCVCSNDGPDPGAITSAQEVNSVSCPNSFAVHVALTTEDFGGCYNSLSSSGEELFSTNQNSVEACYQSCVDFEFATITYTPQGSIRCYCDSQEIVARGTDTTCGTGVYFAYSHGPGQRYGGPSGYVKRQLRERLRLAERGRMEALCPGGMTACNIIGGEGLSFECLDTTAELESCGGCSNGVFNADHETVSSFGVDCTTLPGVSMGGVTCSAGECVAYSCQSGYKLKGNSCVAK
nr:uncharacterized protein CI109_005780 [Kwoniella shandongensis]KAA5525898.1 hypothetical protein CI109_005780 [Kwoniella shandongensis]